MTELASYRNIVVLTGAGISRSAGLPTYRGPGGLWTDPELAVLSHADALASRRAEVVDMFWSFRRLLRDVQPTAAHRALARFEDQLPASTQFLLVTQNIDGLHQRAGSRRVCEYHGSLARWRCDACSHEAEPEPPGTPEALPPRHCERSMRPGVVLFGESIPVDAEHAAKRALRDCDLFIAIGTSGTVTPAASFVRWVALNRARSILINLEASDATRIEFTEVHRGAADELVPALLGFTGG